MRIDSHQHFWRYEPSAYAWIGDAMGALRRDFLPQDLRPLLDAGKLDGCIAVQAQETLAETRWLLDLASANDWIRGVVGWVDLCAPDVGAQLDAIASKKLVGVRAVLQAKPDHWMGTSTFFRGLAAVGERDLAYDVLVYAPQLRGAFELCRALPRQRFVLDHLGKPEARTKRIATWRHDLMALASLDHVACKLSGLATEADWGAWTPAHLRTYLDIALDVFGPSRLLFGSDWPVALCAVSYERWHDLVRDWASALTASEQASVFGGAASRVYRL